MVSLASAMPLSFGKISCRISSGGRSSSCKVGPAMTGLRLEGSWEVLWPESCRGVVDSRWFCRLSRSTGSPRGSCGEEGRFRLRSKIRLCNSGSLFGSLGCATKAQLTHVLREYPERASGVSRGHSASDAAGTAQVAAARLVRICSGLVYSIDSSAWLAIQIVQRMF